MKALLMSVLCFGIIGSSAMAAQGPDYKCISEKMQMMDSDNWYNLSVQETKAIFSNPAEYGHSQSLIANEICEKEKAEAKVYNCMVDALEANGAEVYAGLSESQMQRVLDNSSEPGHYFVLKAAQACGKRY